MDNFTNTPPNFSNLPDSTSERKMDAYKLIMGGKIIRELNDIYTTEYKLVKHISYTLQYKNNYYILIQEDLNEGVESATLNEGERLLALSIVKLFIKLSNPKIKLGPYPKKLLDFLKDYLSETPRI